MAFPVEKKLDLSFLGSSWTGAYIAYRGLTFKETKQFSQLGVDANNSSAEENSAAADFVINLLQEHFINGMAYNGEVLVELAATDIQDLPVEVVNKSVETLAGTPSPN